MTKKITLLFLGFLIFQSVNAQNQFKNPVKFKLKNNLTIVVAQNVGSGKIFSRLTVENSPKETDKVAAEILEAFLSSRAEEFNASLVTDARSLSKVSLTTSEANTATGIFDFEQAINFVSASLFDPELAQRAFEKMNDIYPGDKGALKEPRVSALENYLAKHLRASDIYITIAGDISPAEAKLVANRVFGDWNPKMNVHAE